MLLTSRPRPSSLGLAALVLGLGVAAAGCTSLNSSASVTNGDGTVLRFAWDTNRDADCTLTVYAGDEQRVVHTQGQSHEALVVGLPPDAEVTWDLVAERDGETIDRSSGALSTPASPQELATTTVTSNGALPIDGGYLATSLIGASVTAVVLDGEGRYVWWSVVDDSDSDLTITRTRLSRDGTAMLYGLYDPLSQGDDDVAETIVRAPLDGSARSVVAAEGLHHDFVELPDGSLAWISFDVRTLPNGDQVRGDRIQERHPNGAVRTIWSAWDDFEYDPTHDYGPKPWTHANSLRWVEADDSFLVSLYGLSTVVEVGRETGEVLWSFGAEGDVVPDAPFEFQHQPSFTEQGLLVFVNGDFSDAESRVVEYGLDGGAVASEIWSYQPDPSVYTFAMGDVSRLAGGSTVVDWGTRGVIDEVAADGELLWSFDPGDGQLLGFMEWMDLGG